MNGHATRNGFRIHPAAVLVLVSVLGLAACLPVRVGDPEKSRVDPRFNSAWLTDEPEQLWAFRPWDERTWLVMLVGVGERAADSAGDEASAQGDASASSAPASPADASETSWSYERSSYALEGAIPHKGWLTSLGGKQFLVLEPAAVAPPSSAKDYPISGYVWLVFRIDWLDADTVQFRRVDEDFGGLEGVATSAEAERIIAENVDNPALYGEDTDKPDDSDRPVLRRPTVEQSANIQRLLWKDLGYSI